jgi:hypothetical protein
MREQQSVRPAPPRRMSAKQMNTSLLCGIFNGCNAVDQRHTIEGGNAPLWNRGRIGIRPLLSYKCCRLCGVATPCRGDPRCRGFELIVAAMMAPCSVKAQGEIRETRWMRTIQLALRNISRVYHGHFSLFRRSLEPLLRRQGLHNPNQERHGQERHQKQFHRHEHRRATQWRVMRND